MPEGTRGLTFGPAELGRKPMATTLEEQSEDEVSDRYVGLSDATNLRKSS